MFARWNAWVTLALLVLAAADETPPGLVSTDAAQDLVAEASQTGAQAQKRESGLSNSYGEPLPSDAYGPPQSLPSIDLQIPSQVYGVPETIFLDQPPGAYGPPAPVVFPSQTYEGPPPPFSKPKPLYGPSKHHIKQSYGPPKPIYGPPKKIYRPPKQVLPKQNYGVPFKSFPKPVYGPPKPIYGPPKPLYGPPKLTYGPPQINVQNIPVPEIPVSFPQNFGPVGSVETIGNIGNIGANYGSIETSVGTSIGTSLGSNDLALNLPAPIYGTPIPNFNKPSDVYGPPGISLGPIGPNDQVVVQDFGSIGHYGPPQPDPNPRPPHPGIPAPPTPPHVLYDGWKPIPGISKPFDALDNIHTLHSSQNIGQNLGHIEDQYGPPPPPPPNQDGHNIDNSYSNNQNSQFGAQINTGYSSVHQDVLANIDLNAIVGGDSNHIDQSKTVFEAHYTDNSNQNDLALIQNLSEKPIDTYISPPLDQFSNGPYPQSLRQQGAKGLSPPSGVYGVPIGSQYGAPPKPLPANLPIPYGSFSGGGHSIHTGGHTPRHPVKFRESVPDGLIQQIGHIVHHKDTHGIDHIKQGPAYLPPPIRDVKDINQQTGNQGVSISIEPSSLYSLPHASNPINFQVQQPNNLYGSPIDSYSAPLLTVSDHTASDSSNNPVTATIDGTILANLSNLEAAAILKHCPYHEAILKAAKMGQKIPSDLASSYVASLSSLGSALKKNQLTLISPQNGNNSPASVNEAAPSHIKDQSTASQTLVHTVLPSNYETDKKNLKSKSLKDSYKQNSLQQVSDQIYKTSEKIKSLSEEAKNLQQKLVSSNNNINQFSNQIVNFGQEIPVKGNQATYSVQIQSANGDVGGKASVPSIPHEQLLSEGLLQSILQAIEQPSHNRNIQNLKPHQIQQSNIKNNQNQFNSYQLQSQANANQNIFNTNQNQQTNANNIQNLLNNQNQQSNTNNIQSQFNSHQSQQSQINNNQNQFNSHQIQQTVVNSNQNKFSSNQIQQANAQISQVNQNNYQVSTENLGQDGLILPDGYEPVDRTKDKQKDQETQSSNINIRQMLQGEIISKHRGDISDCDLRPDNSVTHTIIVPPPNIDKVEQIDEIDDNDVAVYFGKDDEGTDKEQVTEISVATSISENTDKSDKTPEFGDKIKKE